MARIVTSCARPCWSICRAALPRPSWAAAGRRPRLFRNPCMRAACLVLLLSLGAFVAEADVAPSPAGGVQPPTLDAATADRFAALALKFLHQEYPNHILHTLMSDADV